MNPPVTIAPSHSRTYRSLSPVACAICSLVEGGSSAILSNSPVRWPMLVIKPSTEPLRIPTIWPANATAFAWSMVSVAIPEAPPWTISRSAVAYHDPRSGGICAWSHTAQRVYFRIHDPLGSTPHPLAASLEFEENVVQLSHRLPERRHRHRRSCAVMCPVIHDVRHELPHAALVRASGALFVREILVSVPVPH